MFNAVVTGASRGIGRFIVKELCNKGWRVLGIARSSVDLESLRNELKGCFDYVTADLSDLNSIDTVVNAVRDRFSNIHLLVNNAGAGLYKGVFEHNVGEVAGLVNLNMVTPVVLTIKLLPYMPKGSTVVFVITAAVFVAFRKLPVYGAAKAGLHYLVKIIGKELEEKGVNVIRVYPGYVDTDFHIRGGYRGGGRGVKPEVVAKKIVEAVEKRKKVVYTPWYMVFARLLSGFDHPVL